MAINTEKDLTNYIFNIFKSYFKKNADLTLEKEGALEYTLPNNVLLSHKSDILITNKRKKYVSIEVKFKSAVTDQFKSRSYDMLHLKSKYSKNILGILIFVKVPGHGISIEKAKKISYPFDSFMGIDFQKLKNDVFQDLLSEIQKFYS